MKALKRHRVAAVEAELVKRVRVRGRISRVQLARELKIAPSTAGIYVDRLVSEGFLLESGKTQAGFGRPPTLLTLNPAGGRFVGIDFEARNILAVAVDFSLASLRQVHRRIATTDSVPTVLARIEAALRQAMAGDRRPVLGIGVGVPGDVDPVSGLALHYPFIRGWKDVSLGERLQTRFGVPVFLENNTRAMALAEMWFGQGRGLRDFICLGVRSGIAAGVVANGRLLRGAANQAGEIGRWSCPVPEPRRHGTPSHNGDLSWSRDRNARLEYVASLSAALKAAAECVHQGHETLLARHRGELTAEILFGAVRRGDACARSIIHRVAEVQGWALGQLATAFNPEKIILTGPLTELGELFLDPLRAAARRWAAGETSVPICCSTLGKFNGALGAAALALHQWKPK